MKRKINAALSAPGRTLAALLPALAVLPPLCGHAQDITVSSTQDLGATTELKVWDKVPVEVNDQGRPGSFVCRSATDSSTGACPTALVWGGAGHKTPVRLRFTEARSRKTKELTLTGRSANWCNPDYPLNYGGGCPYNSGYVNISLSAAELKTLPAGGIWTARLVLDQMYWISVKGSTWTTDITLKLTDSKNASIYLTDGNKQSIDLGLKEDAGGKVTGRAEQGLCLYDGFGSNSLALTLQFDGEARHNNYGAAANAFRVASDTATNSIAYGVDLTYNGSRKPVTPGTPIPLDLAGIALTTLTLDDGSQVYCVPASIALTTPSFRAVTRAAGHYTGTLKVTLNVPAITP